MNHDSFILVYNMALFPRLCSYKLAPDFYNTKHTTFHVRDQLAKNASGTEMSYISKIPSTTEGGIEPQKPENHIYQQQLPPLPLTAAPSSHNDHPHPPRD